MSCDGAGVTPILALYLALMYSSYVCNPAPVTSPRCSHLSAISSFYQLPVHSPPTQSSSVSFVFHIRESLDDKRSYYDKVVWNDASRSCRSAPANRAIKIKSDPHQTDLTLNPHCLPFLFLHSIQTDFTMEDSKTVCVGSHASHYCL